MLDFTGPIPVDSCRNGGGTVKYWFVPGGVGPSSSFGLGPSFTVCGAGGSSLCVDGAAGGLSFFVGGGAGGLSYCLWVVVVCPRLAVSGWWWWWCALVGFRAPCGPVAV